jgi:NAD(P)-dependent dehydrogenase (short-subunit alcohol dehydrogenase family)
MNSPRIVLITGSGSGIGLAAAVRFARAGDTVVAGVRDLTTADALRAALGRFGEVHEIVELDVSGPDVEQVVSDAIERHGRIDVLVNNAARSYNGALEDVSVDDLRRSVEINYLGTARATRAVLPAMRAAGGGRIIAVSSVNGVRGLAFNDAYAASKFAIEGLYESLAPVVAMFGIHVTLLEPGPVKTAFLSKPNAHMAGPSKPYAPLYEAFDSMRASAFEQSGLSPEAVADVLHGISILESPPLRAQDSDFTRGMVAEKLADVDGSAMMRITRLFRRALTAEQQ